MHDTDVFRGHSSGPPYLPLVALRGVGQEAGVHVLQVGAAGADGGDAERVAAVAASALVQPVVRVVEGLGMRAGGAAAAGLGQLPAGDGAITRIEFSLRAHHGRAT